MKKLIIVVFGICAGFVMGLNASALAETMDANKNVDGIVLDVAGNTLTIQSLGESQEDQAAAEETDPIDFQISDQTEFKNVSTLSDLQQGDRVEITYQEEGEQKIALVITKIQLKAKQVSENKFTEKLATQ